ncbi:5507_t:CDS:2, partial [Entrophospora sp. SA101]
MEIYNLLVNQYLLPECLNAVKYPAFWESTDEPSLKNFLDFRLSAGNLKDMKTEHNHYNNELNEISKFYTEVSESGQEVLGWKKAFKASKLYILFWIRIMSTSTTLQPITLVVGMTACLLMSYTPRTILKPFIPLSTSTTLQPVALVVGTTACLLVSYTQWALGTIVLVKDSYSIIEYNLEKKTNAQNKQLISSNTHSKASSWS